MKNNISDSGQLNQLQCPFCEMLNNANAKFCRKCGKNISVFSNKVEQEPTGGNANQQMINKCPNCGSINRPEAMFCKECGNKLIPVVMREQSQPSIAQLEKSVQQQTVTPVQPAPVLSEKEQDTVKATVQTVQETVNRCPKCGAINDQGAAFCKGCGQKLATVTVQQANAIAETKHLPSPAPVSQVLPEPAQMNAPEKTKEPEIIKAPEKIEPVKPVQETMAQADIKFCPSCGASNKPDAGFCKECGQKLLTKNIETSATQVQTAPQTQAMPNQVPQESHMNTNSYSSNTEPFTQTPNQQTTNVEKRKSFSGKKIIIPLLCILLILAGAGGFYLYKNGKLPNAGSDNPVKNYVEALSKQNYAAAYQLLNVKESAFVNAGQFEKFVKGQSDKSESVFSKVQGALEKINTEKKRETENSIVYEVKATANGQPVSFMMEMDKQTKKINLAEKDFAPVELEVPSGTELKVDGVKVENGYKLDGLFAGKHSVEAQNPFLELGYYNNFNFEPEKQTKVKLVHTAWLKADRIGAVDNASLSFVNAFLKATITNEGLKHETLKYKDDDSITNMYQKINTYMLKNGITEMVMTEGKTTNPVYATDGKIHSQYEFSGTYKKGQDGRSMNANGSIQLQFDIEGNDVIVSKVDSYNLHVKK